MTTVRDAAAGIVGQAAMPAGGIGAPLRRHEGRAKVTGAAKYAGEELPPNTLHAAIVASSIASGRVTSIDVARARTVAGGGANRAVGYAAFAGMSLTKTPSPFRCQPEIGFIG